LILEIIDAALHTSTVPNAVFQTKNRRA